VPGGSAGDQRPDSSDVTLAFAGAGWVAAVHGYAVEHLPDVRITRVASRDPRRAAEAARRIGAEPCTYDELPAGADGVVICTPPAQHASQALAALAAGAGVLVEKPLCTTLAEADQLVQAAEGGCLAYAENLVHSPAVRVALSHVAQLDDVDLIEVRALQGRPTWGDFLTEGWGGGVLFDLGAHPLAIALLLAAPARPVELRAVLDGADDHPLDDHAEVTIQLDTGGQVRVVTSYRYEAAPAWDAQVSSPDGVVRLELIPHPLLERNGVEVRLPDRPDGVPAPLADLGYLGQLDAFARDLAEGRTPEVGAAFGRSVLDITCAAYASAAEGGAWVPLPFEGPRGLTPHQIWRGAAGR
jgi:predicted dehydrogenase